MKYYPFYRLQDNYQLLIVYILYQNIFQPIDPDVPLAEIEEEEVPLTDVPKTGDSSNMMLWMMMALLSAAALAGIRIAERKEK